MSLNQTFVADLDAQIAQLKTDGVYKRLNFLESPQGPRVRMEGRGEVIVLSSNNYLGLANEPAVVEAGIQGLQDLGAGTASVRFICGTFAIHRELEAVLAKFVGTPASLSFVSAWNANEALTPTIMREGDFVVSDALNHASIIDSIRLAKAITKCTTAVYKHGDMDDLKAKLEGARSATRRMIWTDGIFSMEGAIAKLPEILELARQYDAIVVVDDSHATGVLGKTGRGTAEHHGVLGEVDVITSTLGKALGGAAGGFIAGPASLCDMMTQRSRPQLFSNALPPTVAASSLAAVRFTEAHPERVAQLQENSRYFRAAIQEAGFNPLAGETPIVPIIVGETALAIRMSELLLDEGVFVTGFGFPVVPHGTARVRCQVSAAHTRADLDAVVDAFKVAGRKAGILEVTAVQRAGGRVISGARKVVRTTIGLVAVGLQALVQPASAQAPIRTPSQALGIAVGADRVLADWPQITRYFGMLATSSPMVRVDTLGETTMGRPFVVATISSPANMRRLNEIRLTQARLADPRGLPAAEERRLVDGQPAVIFISCNLHSSEIGSSQMAMELAYRLVTVGALQRLLQHTVVLLVPSMNPDGQQMIVDWYRTGLGTPLEGGAMPWIYHQYAGHDNNRDWFMVTQKETRMVTDLLYRRWFPTVFYDVHQQGSAGMRLSLPPHVDPINPNVDPLIVRGINLIGMQMQFALEGAGKTGVGDGVTYDLWWHGGARSTPTRHNMVGLLTEAASVKIATPITQKREELTGHPRGLTTYEQKVNFPNPWPGGTWRLRDIMDYELIAAEALVELASTQRQSFVRNFVQLGRKAVRTGETDSPRAWIIPSGQRDPSAVQRLVEVLRLGAVEVSRATAEFTVNGRRYPSGSYIVNMAQPYRAHAKDLLEVQRFPRMEKYPGGPVEPPYDVAGWTLPFQFGVRAEAVPALPSVAMAPVTEMRDNAVDCGDVLPGTGFIALDPRDTRSYALVSRALSAGVPARVSATPLRTAEGNTLPTGSWVLERMPPATALKGDRGCGGPLHTVAALPEGTSFSLRMTAAPRVALYKPWTAMIDEGWTRWVFEQFGMGYASLTDSMARAGNLRQRYDVIVVPDMTARQMRSGMAANLVPDAYAGGLGEAGVTALRTFVQQGGRLVLLDHASQFAVQELGVKVGIISGRSEEDVGARVGASNSEQLYAPGSILRTLVDTTQALAIGAADTVGVYFTNSVTFDVSDPAATIVARYPARAADILMSGYLQGAGQIAGKATLVKVNVGLGSVVMFGFRPQHRGQAYGTFRLLFNAILR